MEEQTDIQSGLIQIGELAKRAGVTVRTVRYYLEEGFIRTARRSQGGFYLFEPHAAQRVRFIHQLKNLGLPLKEIKELFKLRRSQPTGDQAYGGVLARLEQQRELVRAKLAEFGKLEKELSQAMQLVRGCKGCDKEPTRENCLACPLVSDLERIPSPFGSIL